MTWIQTASGRRFDLAAPRAEDVDFTVDVPDALARLARFTGHIGSGVYSVAQHSVLCCDTVMMESGDKLAAAYALLHDAKEYALGDWSTPLKQAIEVAASQIGVSWSSAIRATLDRLEDNIDQAIHEAAGLPLRYRNDHIIKSVDLRMLQAERRQLLDRADQPAPKWWWDGTEHEPKPIRSLGRLTVWPWPLAASHFRARFNALVPEAQKILADANRAA